MKIFVNDQVVFEMDSEKAPVNKLFVDSRRGNHASIAVDYGQDFYITFEYTSLNLAPLHLEGTKAEVKLSEIRGEGTEERAKELDAVVQNAGTNLVNEPVIVTVPVEETKEEGTVVDPLPPIPAFDFGPDKDDI